MISANAVTLRLFLKLFLGANFVSTHYIVRRSGQIVRSADVFRMLFYLVRRSRLVVVFFAGTPYLFGVRGKTVIIGVLEASSYVVRSTGQHQVGLFSFERPYYTGGHSS